jgi:hypothetical protein
MMIEITFREFFEYEYPHDEFYELYIMKNGLDEILYIGISSENIWNRWFGMRGHILVGTNYLVGETPVGGKVVDHLPDSWAWKIQLWTFEDCKEYCADQLNPNGRYTIKWLEPLMIQKLRPSLNLTYNLNPGIDHTPLSEKEKKRQEALDRAYREIFEKNSKWKKE